MNRKLRHSIKALSATAAVFSLLLLAGGPVAPLPESVPAFGLIAADNAYALPDSEATQAGARRHLRRSRAALALPYFSFAQGLRHGRS